MKRAVTLAALAAALSWAQARAGDGPGPKEKFFTPHLGDQVPLGLTFRDETGKVVRLGDYAGRGPIILVLAYFQCPRLCKLVLEDLVDGLRHRDVPYTAGKDFEVVVVSFDPREKPDLAARHKAAYVERYGRPGSEAGWHFLTGEQAQIDELCAAVGFRAVWDERQKQYAHARGIMVLTPKGVVSRYFLGGYFPPRDLRLALVESSEGKVGALMDRVLLMCFNYDPREGKYSAAVLRAVRVGGAVTLLLLAGFWLVSWRRRASRGREPLKKTGNASAG
jgi:protein SCO1/2